MTSVATPSTSRNSVALAVSGGRSGPSTGAHQPMASTASEPTRLNGIDGSPAPVAGTAAAAVQTLAVAPAHSWIVEVRHEVG